MPDLSGYSKLLGRPFVVGYFVPVFSFLVVLDLTLSEEFKPRFFETFGDKQFIYLAIASLAFSFLLVPFRYLLFAAVAGGLRRDPPLFWYGKKIQTWRDQVEKKWKVKHRNEWPTIRSVLNEKEQSYYEEAETAATLLIVTGLMILFDAVVLATDGWLNPWGDLDRGILVALPFLIAIPLLCLLYWQACKAVERQGHQVLASYRLHSDCLNLPRNAHNQQDPPDETTVPSD